MIKKRTLSPLSLKGSNNSPKLVLARVVRGLIKISLFLSIISSAQAVEKNVRNQQFIETLTPIALKLAEENLAERQEIIKIFDEFKENKELTEEQTKFVEEKAAKYDIFTKFKGYRRYDLILTELLFRADVVSPSILIGVAAIESDWGSGRVAVEAKNLYKEKLWFDEKEKGLKPLEEKDADYSYKIFPDFYSSMQSYILRINSGVNYRTFRIERDEMRYRDNPLLGSDLAHSMIFDSPLENFAGILDYTITIYKLDDIDLKIGKTD